MENLNSNLHSDNNLSLSENRTQQVSKNLIDTPAALKRLSILMKNHRAARDMGYREYTALFGDLSPNISAIEKCQLIEMPSLKTLSKFADVLGIELFDLIKHLQYGDNEPDVAKKVPVSYIRASIRMLDNHDEVLDCFEDMSLQLIKTRPRQN